MEQDDEFYHTLITGIKSIVDILEKAYSQKEKE